MLYSPVDRYRAILRTSLRINPLHYTDVMMGAMTPLITGVSIVYSSACSGADLFILLKHIYTG